MNPFNKYTPIGMVYENIERESRRRQQEEEVEFDPEHGDGGAMFEHNKPTDEPEGPCISGIVAGTEWGPLIALVLATAVVAALFILPSVLSHHEQESDPPAEVEK